MSLIIVTGIANFGFPSFMTFEERHLQLFAELIKNSNFQFEQKFEKIYF